MVSDYHKAIVAAVASGLVAAIAVITGAMTAEDTFGDIATVTWLYALSAFIVGSGITGGAVAISKANTIKGVAAIAVDKATEPDEIDPNPSTPYPDLEP